MDAPNPELRRIRQTLVGVLLTLLVAGGAVLGTFVIAPAITKHNRAADRQAKYEQRQDACLEAMELTMQTFPPECEGLP